MKGKRKYNTTKKIHQGDLRGDREELIVIRRIRGERGVRGKKKDGIDK